MNYPAGYQNMNLGLDGHTQECEDQPSEQECICDELSNNQ